LSISHFILKQSLTSKLALVFFIVAIMHTFLTHKLKKLSHSFRQGSLSEKICHFLGEVEIVFGFWSFVFLIVLYFIKDQDYVFNYLSKVRYTEAVFVVVVMCISATKPILQMTKNFIFSFSNKLPFPHLVSFYSSVLIIGPLLGSFVTEPAAMTVCALLLKEMIMQNTFSTRFKYATIGLLFVNISIGGVLTPYAAPAVLVVAKRWDWDFSKMISTFGWKSIIVIVIGTIITTYFFKHELQDVEKTYKVEKEIPIGIRLSHLAFLALVVFFHNDMIICFGLFFMFLGWYKATIQYQQSLKIKESLLVGFFLAGLVTLGGFQGWWLSPILKNSTPDHLFFSSVFLTAFTDNAALTYLASLVKNLSDDAKYAVVAGAITGGGLTVIANAPNPSGYGILNSCFGEDGIKPIGLFLAALPFTFLSILAFYFL
jgi:Na+/H+ antiporter NhaD/arsenite permease-like protein